MGKNSVTSFKEKFGATSTFIGGTLSPSLIGIVGLNPAHAHYIDGVDLPLEDWNQDLWDEARLTMAVSDPIDPEKLLQTVEMGGSIPPVKIVFLRDRVLTSEGRRRILAARGANKILIKKGTLFDELIELDCTVDKSTDLEVSVRIGNTGRLEDPPYIKAANAARLKCRGKSEEQISAILEADKQTVGNWLAYAENLDPKIKASVESGAKADRLPFAVAFTLALHSGKGEHKAQNQALEYLYSSGAKLTGEKGRENAKLVMRAIMSGDVPDSHPDGVDAKIVPAAEPSAERFLPLTETGGATTSAPEAQSAPRAAEPEKSAAKGKRTPPVTTHIAKLSWNAIREIAAHLEPSDNDPHRTEADEVSHAVFQVLNGADPTAEGLAKWPRVQEKFRKVVRSGASILPAAPKPAEMTPALDSVRNKPCPNRMCDRGHDKAKNTTCAKCEGYGKVKGKIK